MKYLLAILLLCQCAFGAVYNIDGDFLSVSNALKTKLSGDTVMINQGTWTWDGKSVDLTGSNMPNLVGCGTNSTRIIVTNSDYTVLIEGSMASPFIASSDIYWDHAGTGSGGLIFIGKNAGSSPGFSAYARITRSIFALRSGTAVSVGYGGSKGVVDNCIFFMPASTANGGNFLKWGGNDYLSWAESNPTGTTNGWYVEDSYFNGFPGGIGPSNGHLDAYNGAVGWLRHCFLDRPAPTGFHGYDSQVTSVRYFGSFNNVFTGQSGSQYAMVSRGGVWDNVSNTVTAIGMATNGVFGLQDYRSAFGSYQQSFSSQGLPKTNFFVGTATSATSGSLTAANVPYGVELSYYIHEFLGTGRTITITGGTGVGQTKTITDSTISSATAVGTVTYTISGSFSPVPDATSTFEIRYANGSQEQIGNQPYYTFTTGTPSIDRAVKVGATLADTLSNLKACINGESSAAGTKYFTGSTVNWDFTCLSSSATNIILFPKMDGPGALGYPGAQMNGVISVEKGSSNNVVLQPNISFANTLNGSQVGFALVYDATGGWPYFNTNAVKMDRDYFETNAFGRVEQAYPLPVRSVLTNNDCLVTLTSSGASPTITTTEDLIAGSGAGARLYHVGEIITNSVPATSGGMNFLRWERDGAFYSTSASISLTVDQARTFTAFYGTGTALPPVVVTGKVTLRGAVNLKTARQ